MKRLGAYFWNDADPIRAALHRGFALGVIVVILVEAFLLYGRAVRAERYIGAGIGAGSSYDGATYAPEVIGRQYVDARKDASSSVVQAFAGIRSEFLGGEIGYLRLPKYDAFARGLNPSRSASQEITAQALYARVMVWTPPRDLRGYAFAGLARVSGRNHEYGERLGVPVEHRNETSERARYVGAGIEYRVNARTALRLELGVLPHAVRSHWTGDRTYTYSTMAVQHGF